MLYYDVMYYVTQGLAAVLVHQDARVVAALDGVPSLPGL